MKFCGSVEGVGNSRTQSSSMRRRKGSSMAGPSKRTASSGRSGGVGGRIVKTNGDLVFWIVKMDSSALLICVGPSIRPATSGGSSGADDALFRTIIRQLWFISCLPSSSIQVLVGLWLLYHSDNLGMSFSMRLFKDNLMLKNSWFMVVIDVEKGVQIWCFGSVASFCSNSCLFDLFLRASISDGSCLGVVTAFDSYNGVGISIPELAPGYRNHEKKRNFKVLELEFIDALLSCRLDGCSEDSAFSSAVVVFCYRSPVYLEFSVCGFSFFLTLLCFLLWTRYTSQVGSRFPGMDKCLMKILVSDTVPCLAIFAWWCDRGVECVPCVLASSSFSWQLHGYGFVIWGDTTFVPVDYQESLNIFFLGLVNIWGCLILWPSVGLLVVVQLGALYSCLLVTMDVFVGLGMADNIFVFRYGLRGVVPNQPSRAT